MSEELKPCPFCGGKAELKRHDDTFSVICEHHEWSKLNADGIRTAGDIAIYADIQGEYNFDTHELEYSPEEIERCKNAVIEAWNTRAERTYYRAVQEGYLVVPAPDKTVTPISISPGRFGITDFVDTYSRVLEKHVQDEIIAKSIERCGYVKKRTCKIDGTYDDEFGIYDHLSCGHVAMRQWPEKTNYCPNCGAKVIDNEG